MQHARVLLVAVLVAPAALHGQWQPQPPSSSGPIYYTGGSVGIGTNNPQTLLHVFGGALTVSSMPADDQTHSITQLLLGNRGAGGALYRWGLFTAAVGGGHGVTSNAFEIWEYPGSASLGCCHQRLVVARTTAPPSSSTPPVVIDGGGGLHAPSLHSYATTRLDADVIIGGSVGLGTDSPSARLSVSGTGIADFGVGQMTSSVTNARHLLMGYHTAGNYGSVMAVEEGVAYRPLVLQRDGGNVGIGTANPTQRLHVEGNIHVSGNINAKYQDLAEWVASESNLDPGIVVVLHPLNRDTVRISSRAYDTSVAGVVSGQPGIVLGEPGLNKEAIATTGRVRVRVEARKSSIKIGDLLVSSDRPGMAMRSEPIKLRGRSMHQPGTIIGKALEPLSEGLGEILVLLSLQ